jgi:MYXO-CTERM domain-containing protein
MHLKHALWIAIVSLSSTAVAAPPPCHRWHNQLEDCEALDSPGCKPTGLQKEVANGQRFGPTALDVCKKLIKHKNKWSVMVNGIPLTGYTQGETIRACWFTSTGTTCNDVKQDVYGFPNKTSAYCVYDLGSDGIDWNDASAIGMMVDYLQVTPEPHCFCTANGPYADLEWSFEGVPLWKKAWELWMAFKKHYFPSAMKTAILDENFATNNSHYISDAIVKGTEANPVWFDNEPILQLTNPENADAAQIDHIIPRVDSQGCLCGDVTPNNAAVISLELNQTMSNISPSWNIDRSKMYAKYVTCPDPEVARYKGPKIREPFEIPFAWALEQQDETTFCAGSTIDQPPPLETKSFIATQPIDEDVGGGCSVGGAGAGLGAVIAGLFATRRRRRAATA